MGLPTLAMTQGGSNAPHPWPSSQRAFRRMAQLPRHPPRFAVTGLRSSSDPHQNPRDSTTGTDTI
jgi:hypothetical protein